MENDVILCLNLGVIFLNDIVNYLRISLFCSATQRLLSMELSIYAQTLGIILILHLWKSYFRIKVIS